MGIRKCLSENSRYWYFAPLVSRCSSSCRHSGTVSDWELLIRRYPGDPRALDRSPSSHIQLPVLCVPPTAPESAIKLTGPDAEGQRRTPPRVCSRPASTLGVGQYAARSKPAVWDTYPGALDVPAKVGQLQRTSQ